MAQHNDTLVSIVTPSLNQGRFFEQTVVSILQQTYGNIEYIIMDGGSTDNTIDIIKKYEKDARVHLYREKDNGQYDAVNKGFLRAHGEIIGWINADDYYTQHAVEKVVRAFCTNVGVDVVYGKFCHVAEDNTFLRERPSMPYSLKWLRRYCYINPSVTFIKSSIIHDEGLLIDNAITNYGDWDWFLRMAERGKKFLFVPEIIGCFRIHRHSKIAVMNRKKIEQERRLISRQHEIALSYINMWVDVIMPWLQRIEYFLYLVKQRDVRMIICRLIDITKRVCYSTIRLSIGAVRLRR